MRRRRQQFPRLQVRREVLMVVVPLMIVLEVCRLVLDRVRVVMVIAPCRMGRSRVISTSFER